MNKEYGINMDTEAYLASEQVLRKPSFIAEIEKLEEKMYSKMSIKPSNVGINEEMQES